MPLAEGCAIFATHKVSPALEDGMQFLLFVVFTFRMRHRIVKIADLL